MATVKGFGGSARCSSRGPQSPTPASPNCAWRGCTLYAGGTKVTDGAAEKFLDDMPNLRSSGGSCAAAAPAYYL
jgi:hypothetical protein